MAIGRNNVIEYYELPTRTYICAVRRGPGGPDPTDHPAHGASQTARQRQRSRWVASALSGRSRRPCPAGAPSVPLRRAIATGRQAPRLLQRSGQPPRRRTTSSRPSCTGRCRRRPWMRTARPMRSCGRARRTDIAAIASRALADMSAGSRRRREARRDALSDVIERGACSTRLVRCGEVRTRSRIPKRYGPWVQPAVVRQLLGEQKERVVDTTPLATHQVHRDTLGARTARQRARPVERATRRGADTPCGVGAGVLVWSFRHVTAQRADRVNL